MLHLCANQEYQNHSSNSNSSFYDILLDSWVFVDKTPASGHILQGTVAHILGVVAVCTDCICLALFHDHTHVRFHRHFLLYYQLVAYILGQIVDIGGMSDTAAVVVALCAVGMLVDSYRMRHSRWVAALLVLLSWLDDRPLAGVLPFAAGVF